MAKVNVPKKYASVKTHEGGAAVKESALLELRRTLSTCLLFENTFYESGDSIANRLLEQAEKVSPSQLMDEIIRAKEELWLRSAPLWMAAKLTSLHRGSAVGDTITRIVTRVDQLSELLAMYWKQQGGKKPLTKQLKRGLANAFGKFDQYQFSKWDREGEVKLRDVMFLTHPKPSDKQREALYKMIAEDNLPPAATWEVGLSAAKTVEEKRAAWRDLLQFNRLGALALVRNLRNMEEVGVPRSEVMQALDAARTTGILPYQLLAAWKNAPAYAAKIDELVRKGMAEAERLPGQTLLIGDVSGSMQSPLASKSEMNLWQAMGAVAAHFIGVSEDVRMFVFSNAAKEIPVVPGFGIITQIGHHIGGGTYLGETLRQLKSIGAQCDRVVVITDEQAQDGNLINTGAKRHYIINVAPYQYGVACAQGWTKISGFSPAVVDWVRQEEREPLFDR